MNTTYCTYNWLHDTMILPRCATFSLLINDEQYEWCMPFRCVPCPYLWPQFSLRLPTRPCQATVMLTQCSRWFWREWVVSLSIRFLVLRGWSLLQLFHRNMGRHGSIITNGNEEKATVQLQQTTHIVTLMRKSTIVRNNILIVLKQGNWSST